MKKFKIGDKVTTVLCCNYYEWVIEDVMGYNSDSKQLVKINSNWYDSETYKLVKTN